MAQDEERIKITYDTNASDAAKDVNKLAGSLDNVDDAQKKVSKSAGATADAVTKNGGAIAILDAITGGWATTLKDSYEASELFNGGMGKMLKSVKTFSTGAKAALISTGIGALVVLVGTLVAYWDDIVGLVSGVSREMKNQNELAAKNVEEQQKQLDILNSQDNILKLQGKSEKEILDLKIKQTDETIKSLEAQLIAQQTIKEAQIKTAQRNRDILSGLLMFISLPITALLKAVDLVGKAFGKDFNLSSVFERTANLVFDPDEVREEGNKEIEETKKKLLGLKNTVAGYHLAKKDIDKRAAEDAKKTKDELDKAELERQKEHDAKMLELLNEKNNKEKAILQELQDFYDVTEQQKLDRLKERADEEVEILKQKGVDTTNIQRLNEEKFLELQKELNANRAKEIEEGYKADAEAAIERGKAVAEQEAAIVQGRMTLAESFIGFLRGIAGRNKALQKASIIAESALGIGKSVIETNASNVATIAQGAALAIPTGGASVAAASALVATNYASLGLGIAANVAATAKALQALGGGGGAPSAGAAAGGRVAAASPQVAFNNSAENQIGQSVSRTQAEQPPIRVFVAESDISEAQTNVKAVVDTNTFG